MSAAASIAWPQKTKELCNRFLDSTIWNDFKYRHDDIVVSTYGKSGTTWMQQIIGQMLYGGDPDLEIHELSPWVEFVLPPKAVKLQALEAQNGRRLIKTHLPVPALVYSPQARYVYVGRDGRDVLWSLHNHHYNGSDAMFAAINNAASSTGPLLEPASADIHQYWHDWMANDGAPYWPFWENVRSWWEIRHLPNVMLVHFDVLKRRMPEEMRRIARFLDITIDESKWNAMVEHCTFDWMKSHADTTAPMRGVMWKGGAKTFINKGTNGRWRDTLTAQDVAEYEDKALAELGPECSHWLATGEGA